MALPAKISALIADLESATQAMPVSGDDFYFLKLDKAGTWIYGTDETEVDLENSAFVIDPATYCQGFVAWDDGDLVDEQMALAGEPPIARGALADVSPAKWQPQVGIALKGISGPDKGAQLLYKVSSKGGTKAVKTLLDEIIKRGKAGETELCPVVFLEVDSYRHKKYGKIFTPILSIESWTDVDADVEVEAEPVKEPEVEAKVEEAPKATRRRRRRA